MFNLKRALSVLPEGVISYEILKRKIADILWENRADLDQDYYAEDVINEGFEKGWFKMTDTENVYVDMSIELKSKPPHLCPFVASGGFHGDDCLGLSRNQELDRLRSVLVEIRKEVNSVKGTYRHPDQLEEAVFAAFTNIVSILKKRENI